MRTLVILLVAALVIAALWWYRGGGPEVQPGSVVMLEMRGEYVEAAEPPLLAHLFGEVPTPLLRFYSDLRKAERDDRVHAVVLRIGPTQMGWAKAQEVRAALLRLHEAGRKTAAYLEIEPVGANVEYYVASAADEVWVAPGTRIPFVGLAAEYLFLGGLFDKLGVDLEVERVGPYKTAADFFASREMSPEGRKMAGWLLDSIEEQFVSDIAAGRGLAPEDVKRAFDAAPTAPADLKAAGLVDREGFLDELVASLGEERQVLEPEQWSAVDPSDAGFGEPQACIALVYGSGNVVHGEGERGRRGQPVLASRTVAEALEKAADDDSVDAILFRVDSPGGSALAADLVWHATQEARKKKPLVVSFSDVAASGGYYVAAGADAIVARPGTITGSIGVLMIRPVLERLYEKLGIGTGVLTRGDGAVLFTSSVPLDEEQRARLQEEVERTYQLFLDRVVAGRGLERDAVERVARGRVWTGAQALERGLVDGLGGLHGSLVTVRQKLGLADDADVEIVVFPPPKPLAEQIAGMLQGAAVRAAQPAIPLPRLAERVLGWMEAFPVTPVLLPPLAVEVH